MASVIHGSSSGCFSVPASPFTSHGCDLFSVEPGAAGSADMARMHLRRMTSSGEMASEVHGPPSECVSVPATPFTSHGYDLFSVEPGAASLADMTSRTLTLLTPTRRVRARARGRARGRATGAMVSEET